MINNQNIQTKHKNKGFTLAEVLITLTIIGVVAALTIPSLLANVNDKSYETKRKGFATRLAQAVSQLDNLNSYEAKRPSDYSGALNADDYSKVYSSMNLVVEGLSKVMKITNTCDFDSFTGCDFPATFGRWYDSAKLQTRIYKNQGVGGNDGVAIKTKNGESLLLWYNPNCLSEQIVQPGGSKRWSNEVCITMWIDLDGAKKGPNSQGKDIVTGIVLYPDTPYVVIGNPKFWYGALSKPSYSDSTASDATAEKYCMNVEALGFRKGSFTLPTKEEGYLVGLSWAMGRDPYWTSSLEGSGPDDYGWMIESGGWVGLKPRTTLSGYGICIQKD